MLPQRVYHTIKEIAQRKFKTSVVGKIDLSNLLSMKSQKVPNVDFPKRENIKYDLPH